jgi:hypothetical protein
MEYDTKKVVVDPVDWKEYSETLITILEIESEADKSKILNLEFTILANELVFIFEDKYYNKYAKIVYELNIKSNKYFIWYTKFKSLKI